VENIVLAQSLPDDAQKTVLFDKLPGLALSFLLLDAIYVLQLLQRPPWKVLSRLLKAF
jgi:hypothetical protein